jgi:S1-C subfamily serine protease
METRVGPAGELIPGDIIQRVDEEAVANREELSKILSRYAVGDRVRLRMIRDGREIEVSVALGGEANGAD